MDDGLGDGLGSGWVLNRVGAARAGSIGLVADLVASDLLVSALMVGMSSGARSLRASLRVGLLPC